MFVAAVSQIQSVSGPSPYSDFMLFAPFENTDPSPVTSYTARTGQDFTIVQTSNNLYMDLNYLKKTGSGSFGTNTVTTVNSFDRANGICLASKIEYTSNGIKVGFLQAGVSAHFFQVSNNKVFAIDRFSSLDIGYNLTSGKVYYCFLILRENGAYWIFQEEDQYYLISVSSKYSYASMNVNADLAGTSALDWFRMKELTTPFNSLWGLAVSSITDAVDNDTFTHNTNGWIVFYLQTKATNTGEIQFRIQDDNNYLKLTFNSTNVGRLYQVVSGVETQLGIDFIISQGDEYRIFLNGSDVRFFTNLTTALSIQVTNTNFTSRTSGKVLQGGGNVTYIHTLPFEISNNLDVVSQLQEITSVSEPTSEINPVVIEVSNSSEFNSAYSNAGPGTTILMNSGTYELNLLQFNAFGSQDYPLYIKPSQGESVIINTTGDFILNGSDVIFDGTGGSLTIMTDAWTGDRFLTSQNFDVGILGARVKFINIIIHDFGNLGVWSTAVDAIMYGCLVYNIGRGNGSQGHPIYTQNNVGLKNISNNLIVQTFESAFAIHMYGSGSSQLKGYVFRNNITQGGRFLCGSGGTPVTDLTIISGVHCGPGQMEIGQLGSADPDHNHFYIDSYKFWNAPLQIKKGGDFRVVNNVFDLKINAVIVINNTFGTVEINSNDYSYHTSTPTNKWQFDAINSSTFANWQSRGFDQSGSYTEYSPGASPNDIVVYPNDYDNDRATVAIKNLTQQATVEVTLPTSLTNGITYHLLNGQNPEEYHSFVYDGLPVIVPMTGWTVSRPIGTDGGAMAQIASIFPNYGVFYLVRYI